MASLGGCWCSGGGRRPFRLRSGFAVAVAKELRRHLVQKVPLKNDKWLVLLLLLLLLLVVLSPLLPVLKILLPLLLLLVVLLRLLSEVVVGIFFVSEWLL